MKPGDLVRNTVFKKNIGMIISLCNGDPGRIINHWNVLWRSGKIVAYSEALMEVISETG